MTVWSLVNARLEDLFLDFENNYVELNTDPHVAAVGRRHIAQGL